jgi:hypothetical protein
MSRRGINMAHDVAPNGRETATVRALEELADRLDDIAKRAGVSRWLDHTDAGVAAAAAHHIRAIPEAVAASMREAFDIGRAYGHREVELERITREIHDVSHLLARQAWGGGRPGNA